MNNYIELLEHKFTLWQRIWYPIRRFVRDIPYNLNKIKWFFQRGKRGWADSDVWGMDYYLTRIVPEMLRHLQKCSHGYPGYGKASTPGKWYDLLEEMIDGWDAAKRVCDDEYVDKIQPGWFEKNEHLTKKTMAKHMKMIQADVELFEKKMKLFTKWFFHLWD